MSDNPWHKWPVVLNPERIDSFMKLLLGDKYKPEVPVVVYYRDENCRSYGLVVGKENDTLEDFPDTAEDVTCIIINGMAFKLLGWHNVGVYCPNNTKDERIIKQSADEEYFYFTDRIYALFDLGNLDEKLLALRKMLDYTPWQSTNLCLDCSEATDIGTYYIKNQSVVRGYQVFNEDELKKHITKAIILHPDRIPVPLLGELLQVPDAVFEALTRKKELNAFSTWISELDREQQARLSDSILVTKGLSYIATLLDAYEVKMVYLDSSCNCEYYYICWLD